VTKRLQASPPFVELNTVKPVTSNRRQMPLVNSIRAYWAPKIVKLKPGVFKCPEHVLAGNYCFACGIIFKHLEKAHIKARCEGGSDTVENLHMLCPVCHKDSEMLKGKAYKKWFVRRTHVDYLMAMTNTIRYFTAKLTKWGLMCFLRLYNRCRRSLFGYAVKKPVKPTLVE